MQAVKKISTELSIIEKTMQEMPQAECPVIHRFGEGIYIREVTIPAGTLAIGHIQKFKQNNFLLEGKIAMIGDEGLKIIEAPLFFIGDPGRKIGYVLETVIWQNIWATNETDVEKLEEMYLEKSEESQLSQQERDNLEFIAREVDRQDYLKVIEASPFTHDEVKIQVENEFDQIPTPNDWASMIAVKNSNIQGKGVFNTWPCEEDTILGPCRLDGKRTPLGRYTNHSMTPNASPLMHENGDVYLVSTRSIRGCEGGSKGEEITVNYREMLKLSGVET